MLDQEVIVKAIFVISLGGSIGGLAIGILSKSDHQIRLFGGKLYSLGFIGDAFIGSTASLALFSIIGTLLGIEIKNIGNVDTFIRIFAISIVGGFAGIALLKALSRKLVAQLESDLNEATKKIASLADRQRSENLRERGRYIARRGNHSGSLVYYDEALKIDPNNSEAILNKASALKDSGNVKEALKMVNTLVEKDPTYARAVFNRSSYKALLKRPKKEVLEDLENAISLESIYRKIAIEDEDFISIREDEKFKKITEQNENSDGSGIH